MRDVSPPRITLEFTLTGAGGAPLRSGTRTLRDLLYLVQAGALLPTDPLRQDKALLEAWLRDEFGPAS